MIEMAIQTHKAWYVCTIYFALSYNSLSCLCFIYEVDVESEMPDFAI